MLIDAVRKALEKMDPAYCKLSDLNYQDPDFPKPLNEAKYLERPFAYEFYHQLRCLIEKGVVDFGAARVQGEVAKEYQNMPDFNAIPDFIIHQPSSTKDNFAVIEFKLASRKPGDINDDLDKLIKFLRPFLKYDHIVEVLLGSEKELKQRRDSVQSKVQSLKQPITIVEFDVGSWQANVLYR